jgi:hypothetical protein
MIPGFGYAAKPQGGVVDWLLMALHMFERHALGPDDVPEMGLANL